MPISNPLTLTEIKSIAVDTAVQAGQLLAQRFNPAGTLAQRKADRSLVTEADLAADRFIEGMLKRLTPSAVVLSEEKQTHLTNVPPELWVVDPLDGTTNFSLGLHYWGVSLGYLQDGVPQAAALYFPLLDELYTAQAGQGAELNGQALQTPTGKDAAPNQAESFFSCCSRTVRHYTVNLPYKTRILGSTAYSMCAVGRGMAVASFDVTAKLWDIAGGWLVVKEAGGLTETLQNEMIFPLQPDLDYANKNYSSISAADQHMLQKVRANLVKRD